MQVTIGLMLAAYSNNAEGCRPVAVTGGGGGETQSALRVSGR
jgi:hypothetical protein